MRIDTNFPTNNGIDTGRTGRAGSGNSTQQSAGVGLGNDEARLSVDDARVRGLEAELSRYPEVRKDKVEALQHAISEGTYKPGADQIAEAMFSELFGQQAVK